MRKLLLLPILIPTLAFAEPSAQLQPMAFLAGSCWKGAFPGGQATDEHCFDWMYDGRFLRDRHVVKAPSKPDYVGETIYYWEPEAKQIQYLYVENFGGVSRGTAEAAADGMVFPATRYSDGKMAMTYRSRWTRIDAASYEAHAEAQVNDGWATMFKMKLLKQPAKN